MKINMLSFCTSNFENAEHETNRLAAQADATGIFNSIEILNENTVPEMLKLLLNDRINAGFSRGYAYWSWKPWIILDALQQMNYGDMLLYMDVGCALNANGKERMKDYINACAESPSGILAFSLSSRYGMDVSERKWTSCELSDFIERRYFLTDVEKDEIMSSDQICASSMLLRKSKNAEYIIKEWNSICQERFDLITDMWRENPINAGITEHRHDQSVFSMLCKIFKADLISDAECYDWRAPEGLQGKLPILHHVKYIK